EDTTSLTTDRILAAQQEAEDDTDDLATPTNESDDTWKPSVLVGNSFYWFHPSHPVRIWLAWFVENWIFDSCILVLICFSSILLALDSPDLDQESTLGQTLAIAGSCLAVIFTIEMLMKMIVMQAFLGEGAYIREQWNQLDCFVVCVSIVGIFFSDVAFLRALRALRPLRIIVRLEGFRFVVESITSSIRASSAAVSILFCVGVVLSIIGVQLFAGAFYVCNDLSIDTEEECTGDACVCMEPAGASHRALSAWAA
ncbi:hypothetical protein CYMTET_32830, partial [Cymbomonas tetramitiformis]